ncbi:tetratricopeptide repeat protein [Phenylobacterium sp.]|uniref:tetratricopeptide repeat protein n=1 Tax=Phenylobacterium sp. TaxID=1871053 RepID=UPI0035B24A50
MTDLFEEVEEQLRSDRYRTLARKALPWVLAVLAAALVAALAWWGYTTWRDRESAKASEQYAAALDAFAQGDQSKAAQLWTEVSKTQAPAFKSMALMQLGGLQLADDKVQPAVAYFDQAAEAAPHAVLADAARLKSALALLDTAPYAELEKRLNPLIEDDRPYRIQAREALGFAKLMKGDTAGARGDFLVVSSSLEAPDSVRARAKAAMDLIDSGSAKALAATVKAAAALPRPQGPVGGALPPGLMAPPQAQPQAPGPQ